MKVCFVSLYAYPLFASDCEAIFGGSEVRCHLFASALSELAGWDVSVIVRDHGQAVRQRLGAVTIYLHPDFPATEREPNSAISVVQRSSLLRCCRDWLTSTFGAGWLGSLRVGVQRWRSNWTHLSASLRSGQRRLLRAIDADVYLCFGVSDFSAQFIADAHHCGKPVWLLAGSDSDFSTNYRKNSQFTNDYGSRADRCYSAIVNADQILVQTPLQADLLSRNFGRAGTIIPNPIDLQEFAQARPGQYVLWIGKMDRIKQPEICLEVARQCPEIPFRLILNRVPAVSPEVQPGHMPANVTIVDRVPYREVEQHFAGAAMLLNTSRFEGFPNTFLQAGKYRVPVISLNVDPEQVLQTQGGGYLANGNVERLTQRIRELWIDRDEARRLGDNLHRYVRSQHDLRSCVALLARQFDGLRRGYAANSTTLSRGIGPMSGASAWR